MRSTRACLGVLLGLLLAAVPAGAVTVGTDASYTIGHEVLGPLADQDGPYTATSGTLYSYVSYGIDKGGEGEGEGEPEGEGEGEGVPRLGLEFEGLGTDPPRPLDRERPSLVFGDAFGYASDSGTLSGGASVRSEFGVSSMDFHGSSSWSDTFTNTSGGSGDFDFDFNFAGGSLRLFADGGMAMFSLDILLNGSSIWNRTASLSGIPALAPPVLDADGLSHSVVEGGFSTLVRFDPFSDNLDLGTFGDGESFTLTYNLDVWASTTSPFGVAEARVGDPFSVGFSGTVNAPAGAPVPEPTTMALLGMGLAGLGARRLRAKN